MKDYVGYEYKEIAAAEGDASLWLDGYESFGWHPDANRPAGQSGGRVLLHLKRDRRIVNKMELTRLQRNFESCMREIGQLRESGGRLALAWALGVGLAGTVFMAGAVFAVTHKPPLYLLMGLLSVPGAIGWAAPVFLYKVILHRLQRQVQPLLEAKYEEIDQLCEKGHALL